MYYYLFIYLLFMPPKNLCLDLFGQRSFTLLSWIQGPYSYQASSFL